MERERERESERERAKERERELKRNIEIYVRLIRNIVVHLLPCCEYIGY